MKNNFKIGAVSYLNAKPLIEGIPEENLLLLPPRKLTEAFDTGALDVALLPTYYLFKNPGLRLVQGLGIGCEGTVLTVFIKPQTPDTHQFHRLQSSPESVTSNKLAEVILKKYRHQKFEWVDQHSDGEVIIGDAALEFKSKNPLYPLIDLGDAWWEATELPFLFAAWMIHPRVSDQAAPELSNILHNAWQEGQKKFRAYSRNPLEFQYLSQYLKYEHRDSTEQALHRWQKDLLELKLIDSETHWKWV